MSLDLDANRSWKLWNRQLLNDDKYGDWYAWTLTTHLTPRFLFKKFERRCAFVMSKHGLSVPLLPSDPLPSRTLARRHGVAIFVLPAVSVHGHQHFHGLARVPRSQPLETFTVREQEVKQTLRVPRDIAVIFQTRFGRGVDGTFSDVNILHDNTPVICGGVECIATALPVNERLDIAEHRVVNYWDKTSDGEVREFGSGEWVPLWVRQALPSADTSRVKSS